MPSETPQGSEVQIICLWDSLCNRRCSLQLPRNLKSIIAFTHCGTWEGNGCKPAPYVSQKQLQWHCTMRGSSTLKRDKSINSYLGQWVVCQVQLQEKKNIFETDVSQVEFRMKAHLNNWRMDSKKSMCGI